MSEHKNALANGTVLHQYQIESMIAHGGFGIVYKARHTHLDEAVVIKEYLPSEIATREGTTVHPLSNQEQDDYQDGLNRFLDEAKQLVQFKEHPNIVSCRDFFTENGTAYLVMDYEDGLSLSELLKARNNDSLSEEHLITMMLSLLDGLKLVHEKGVLHRDIKPGNIYIRRKDEQPVLIDFGAAKQNYSKHSKSMAPYTVGYAPMEQVSEEGDLGPWTDIYAIGAVMWRIISGQNPVDVNKRLTAIIRGTSDPFVSAQELGANNYHIELLKVIDRCLKLNEKDRYQTVADLMSALKEVGQEKESAIVQEPSKPTVSQENIEIKEEHKQHAKTDNKGKTQYGKIILAVVIAIGVGFYAVNQAADSQRAEAAKARQEAKEAKEAKEANARFKKYVGKLVRIPSGSFSMGSYDGNKGEKPVHTVRIKSFKMMAKEVTFNQYDAYAKATGKPLLKDEGWGRGNRPVINVRWLDANGFAKWVSKKTGKRFRLPSEAQWEYAARGGSRSKYSWGDNIHCSQARYGNWNGDCGNNRKTVIVGSYSPNQNGLYDMHGNVLEWTQDCWNKRYNGAPTNGKAWLSGYCGLRVLRGGSWGSKANGLRSASRSKNTENVRHNIYGFRLIQD